MGPAARTLLWALLLSLGSPAAAVGRPGLTTPAGTRGASLRLGGPARSRSRSSSSSAAPTRLPRRTRVTEEDENDVLATADRLAGPAAAELLATVTGSTLPSAAGPGEAGDGTLEEGVVIDARRSGGAATAGRRGAATGGRFAANTQGRDIRLTTALPPATSRAAAGDGDAPTSETLARWSTAGATPSRWPRRSSSAMPAPEDLRLELLPWGPWHCHCRSGTMSRSRAGKLHGLAGRLRVGALSQLRTEHRPCTYQQCSCDRRREECPLDSGPCAGCSSPATAATTSHMPPIHQRRRPSPLPPSAYEPSPSPALAFWKQVRMDLEAIWNSLSSVFTETQPTDIKQR